VRLAARGAREAPGGGVVAVQDPEEARQLRRQAGRVVRESAAIAALVTGVTLLARGVFGA
jgi:hypothetical protein